MALLTGCRSGELHALEKTDSDWDRRLLYIHKAYNKKAQSVTATKGGYWRAIPINDELEKVLRDCERVI